MTRGIKRITKEEFLKLVAEWAPLGNRHEVKTEMGWTTSLVLWIEHQLEEREKENTR